MSKYNVSNGMENICSIDCWWMTFLSKCLAQRNYNMSSPNFPSLSTIPVSKTSVLRSQVVLLLHPGTILAFTSVQRWNMTMQYGNQQILDSVLLLSSGLWLSVREFLRFTLNQKREKVYIDSRSQGRTLLLWDAMVTSWPKRSEITKVSNGYKGKWTDQKTVNGK